MKTWQWHNKGKYGNQERPFLLTYYADNCHKITTTVVSQFWGQTANDHVPWENHQSISTWIRYERVALQILIAAVAKGCRCQFPKAASNWREDAFYIQYHPLNGRTWDKWGDLQFKVTLNCPMSHRLENFLVRLLLVVVKKLTLKKVRTFGGGHWSWLFFWPT